MNEDMKKLAGEVGAAVASLEPARSVRMPPVVVRPMRLPGVEDYMRAAIEGSKASMVERLRQLHEAAGEVLEDPDNIEAVERLAKLIEPPYITRIDARGSKVSDEDLDSFREEFRKATEGKGDAWGWVDDGVEVKTVKLPTLDMLARRIGGHLQHERTWGDALDAIATELDVSGHGAEWATGLADLLRSVRVMLGSQAGHTR